MAPATASEPSTAVQIGSTPTNPPPASTAPNAAGIPNLGLDREQLLALIASLPPGIQKVGGGIEQPKPGPQQVLDALSQQSAQQQQQFMQSFSQSTMADPGPSTHPRGPPQQLEEEGSDGEGGDYGNDNSSDKMPPVTPSQALGGRRSKNGAAMGSDEWTRQRKDNHKEVERRRRGNINEGINELGRIVPNGSGEKAKGAILSRAVQYIHHLKENEARNIEKWTLEKLLMDQAMGDLQAQLEEMRRVWEEERMARMRLENELAALKGTKRKAEDESAKEEDGSKRQRTE